MTREPVAPGSPVRSARAPIRRRPRAALRSAVVLAAAASAFPATAGAEPPDPLVADIARAVFERDWTPPSERPAAPADAGGLGPLFNARSCVACHEGGGSGRVETDAAGRLVSPGAVVHLQRPDGSPDPTYGRQIQTRAVAGLRPEAEVRVTWATEIAMLADGTRVPLRRPEVSLVDLAYGPLAPETRPVLRLAPDLTPTAALHALANSSKNDPDVPRPTTVFGYKAGRASLDLEIARALSLDLGLASPDFPDPAGDCGAAQITCRAAAARGSETPPHIMTATVDLLRIYVRTRLDTSRKTPDPAGFARFEAMGCAACHRPTTGDDPTLVFADLRAHDLGPGLADPHGEDGRSPREWRTAPLVGIGRSLADGRPLLHDGRARTVEEAILWHGGAAAGAREAYRAADAEARASLVRFVSGL